MRLLHLPFLALLASFSYSEQKMNPTDPTACNNFYEYVCTGDYKKSPSRVKDYRSLQLPDEVDQYQEYVFTPPAKKGIWEVVDPDIVSKWFVQFETYADGVNWIAHQKRHEEVLALSVNEKQEKLIADLANFKTSILVRFYKSLKQSVAYLTELKIPVSTHNHFYHGLFDDLRELHISDIKMNSRYSEEHKQILIDNVNNLKIIFPYLEYNNASVWRQAMTEYEREYHKLKTLINETEISSDLVEKIVRLAAVAPAMTIFEDYIKGFTERFIFQHVAAAASMDSFNYLNEIHVSVFTMFNPIDDPKAVYRQFLYVLSHELQHVHFNIDAPTFEKEIWQSERDCIVKNLDFFGDHWKANRSDWSGSSVAYEDSANVAGLRLVTLYTAQVTSDNQEIRDVIEQSVGRFCTKYRENKNHNPLDISINLAIAQMPTFKHLYNCTHGDRMFVATKDLCRVLNMDIDENDYTAQKIEYEDLFALTQFMDVLENTADDLDAANITTFKGELFDITVEDVKEKEEEEEEEEEDSEGSAQSSSSSSSESMENEDGENDDLEKVHAEIVASSRCAVTFGSLVACLLTIFVIV